MSNSLLQRANYELAVAEREASEVRASKEQFALAISHELRTPLNIIFEFADIMYHSPEVYGTVDWTPSLRRDVVEIYRNASYLCEFANDIIDLAETEKPRIILRREPTDIASLVAEVVPVAQALLRSKPVQLRVAVPPSLPRAGASQILGGHWHWGGSGSFPRLLPAAAELGGAQGKHELSPLLAPAHS